LAFSPWRSWYTGRDSCPVSRVWLIINGFAYLATPITGLLSPRYEGTVSHYVFPALLRETAFMPWLVIRGAKAQPLGAAA
jgi:hypothetical protein